MSAFVRRLIVVLGLLGAITLAAQTTVIWTGTASDQFNDPDNWQGGVAPAPGSNIVFTHSPNPSVMLPDPVTVGDITFSGIQDGFSLYGSTLTLNGNVATTTGSQFWGFFSSPVTLAAGDHIYTPGGNASIYHFGQIDGAGGIVMNGPNNLYLTQSNTYWGDTVLNGGRLYVGSDYALGEGTVTLNGGVLAIGYADGEVRLGNDFLFAEVVHFDTSAYFYDDDPVGLILGNSDGSSIKPISGVSTVTFNLTGSAPLELAGNMQDGDEATTYIFEANGSQASYILSAYNSYTGGTVVRSGASVVFKGVYMVPEEGLISLESDAYAGLDDNEGDAANFVARFDAANTTGTIGFDGNNYLFENIDLSAFTAGGGTVSLGTLSTATLTGIITPPTGSDGWRFRSSGTLFLEGALTGNHNVLSLSFADRQPGLLILNQDSANTYIGTTHANGAGIIFAGSASLSGGSDLELSNGGYIGVTDSSELGLGNLINQGISVSDSGALGVDSYAILIDEGSTPYTYTTPVDFGGITSPLYLGTATRAIIAGSITTTNSDADGYYFTGFNGGQLRVDTQLTGSKAVHIGMPGVFQSENELVSSVDLNNDTNDFTGGIVLHSGQLAASDPLSLGTGPLTVIASASDSSAYLLTQGAVDNDIDLQSGTLEIYTGDPLTLNGTITGNGGLATNFGSTVTINGENSYSGGSSFAGTFVIVSEDTGLGSGSLALTEGAKVYFSYINPVIGSLVQGDSYFAGSEDNYEQYDAALIVANDGGDHTLTINQSVDGYFQGAILEDDATTTLVKNGEGTLHLGGSNYEGDYPTYSGGTVINDGKLVAETDHALGTGTITINGGSLGTSSGVSLSNPIVFGLNGGTLSGSTTFSTPITAGANVVLSPGDSPGTMTFTAGLTLASGGSLDFEVQTAMGAAGTGYDLVHISNGLLDITATAGTPFTINILSLDSGGNAGNVADFSAGSGGYSWMLYLGNSGSGINGFDPTKFTLNTAGFTNSLNGGVFSLSLGSFGSDPVVFLNFTAVPEPSTYALMFTGLAALALRLRRRR